MLAHRLCFFAAPFVQFFGKHDGDGLALVVHHAKREESDRFGGVDLYATPVTQKLENPLRVVLKQAMQSPHGVFGVDCSVLDSGGGVLVLCIEGCVLFVEEKAQFTGS